ncbi:hypothetical protein I2483_13690 [Sporosarcina sp. E16_3]|uniref:hypothetical protein n=1 Tax=Sporosarcina sp. E16_3 TaxID=2789293 RepID=UPI001A91E412|nr:hypothetical protein [Sporosarcina sp. E16_3]MBO0602715.1 hypothetical protein [Sporosarcina sp. E16_3]
MTIELKEGASLTYAEQLQADYTRIRTEIREGRLPREERLVQIAEVTDRYALAHAEAYDKARESGRVMPINYKNDRLLHAFADLALYEDLTWSHADKMSLVEFPIMSDSQAKRRASRTSMPGEIEHNDRGNNGRQTLIYTDKNDVSRSTKPRMANVWEDNLCASVANIDLHNGIQNAGLTVRQAQAIDLVYGDGKTQEAAASEMGIAKSNVNAYLDVGVAKIRRVMGVK